MPGWCAGDTQRAVKLEITGTRNDELIAYLDDILSDLTSGMALRIGKAQGRGLSGKAGHPECYWERLKAEVAAARQRGYENTQIVAMSETYFEMADETVSAAEHYSEKIAMKIRTIEILSALDMLCLVILIMLQTAMALKMPGKPTAGAEGIHRHPYRPAQQRLLRGASQQQGNSPGAYGLRHI